MIARWLRRLFILAGALLAAGTAIFFALPAVLIVPSDTPKADVIVNYAIDPHSHADAYVAWLYRDGVARKVVTASTQVSHETFPGDFVRDHLIELGVRREDADSLHLPIVECRAAVLGELAKYLKSRGWQSVLLICQPEDSRNTARLARRIFAQEGLSVAVGYAPQDFEEIRADWWKTHWKVQRFVDEAMNVSLDTFYSECR
jgi:hypothetical protein